MKTLESVDEFKTFIKDNSEVLVDFFAEWCQPCKILSPTLEALSEEFENIKFVKVDIDTLESLAEEFNVEAVPTLILFKDEKEVTRQEGALGKAALKKWIKGSK